MPNSFFTEFVLSRLLPSLSVNTKIKLLISRNMPSSIFALSLKYCINSFLSSVHILFKYPAINVTRICSCVISQIVSFSIIFLLIKGCADILSIHWFLLFASNLGATISSALSLNNSVVGFSPCITSATNSCNIVTCSSGVIGKSFRSCSLVQSALISQSSIFVFFYTCKQISYK